MESHYSNQTRIIIYARITDIPGDPQRHSITLGDLFLGRPLRFEIKPTGYDYCLNPPDYYSGKPLRRWFVYDLNVEGRKTLEEQMATPHEVYLASCQDGEWKFVRRDKWVAKAKEDSTLYPWGGRKEQEWLEDMRTENVGVES